jgi:hypothetical protein
MFRLTLHEQIMITIMAQLILLVIVGWKTALLVWVIQAVSSFCMGMLIGVLRAYQEANNHG